MSDWEAVNAENLVRHKYGTYYLSAKVGGKKIRRSLETKSLATAKIKRDAVMADLRAKAGAIRKGGSWTRAAAIEETKAYYSNLPSYKAKPASMHYRQQILGLLLETLPERTVPSWTPADMVAWWTSERIAGDEHAQIHIPPL